jgi:hypothetical protein
MNVTELLLAIYYSLFLMLQENVGLPVAFSFIVPSLFVWPFLIFVTV